MKHPVRRICQWFHDYIVILDGLGPIEEGSKLSHGICDMCKAQIEATEKAEWKGER